VFTGLCAEFSIIVQNSMQVDNASFGGKVRLFPLEIYPISWGGVIFHPIAFPLLSDKKMATTLVQASSP
jgi:hypothetical protein